MCVIIHKPAGKEVSEKDIISAAKRNSHGFGYMYYDPDLKKIVTGKTLFEKPEELFETFKSQVKYEVCYHLRIRTHGDISEQNCHPFKILSEENNGADMYFMHNGMINKVKEEGTESDTRAFNRQFLRPILKKYPELVKEESFRKLVESYIGASKFVFMFGNGETVKCNAQLGSQHDGMWVSNMISFDIPKKHNTHVNNYNRPPYDNDYVNNMSNGFRGKGFNNTETRILNETIKVGDDIYVVHESDPKFLAIGKIKNVYKSSTTILFKDKEGKANNVSFGVPDGKSFFTLSGYQLMPLPSKFESSGLYKNKEIREKFYKQAKKPLLIDVDKKKEKNIFRVFRENLKIQNLSFNSKDYRWGGAFVDTSFTDYDGTSIYDFCKMSAQEQFEFFLDKIPQSFGMLQDLTERIFLEDQECGLFKEGDKDEA